MMLETRNLTRDYAAHRGLFRAGEPVRAVSRVSLAIEAGEIFGLIGASGSGKTTLGLLIAGVEKPSSGEIVFASNVGALGVQMIFQDPRDSLNPRMRIGEAIAEPLAIRKVSRDRIREKLVLVTAKVALGEKLLERYPHQLSGGERQRAVIARAIIGVPRLIIADEPTSMLDPTVSKGIIGLISRLNRDEGITFLFITHDLAEAASVCSRIGIMREGELIETGTVEDIIMSPAHEETRRLIKAARLRELALANKG
jgi:peptide/nickel transport system ATP-binding protein